MEYEEFLGKLQGMGARQAKAMERQQRKERIVWVVVCVLAAVVVGLVGGGVGQLLGRAYWPCFFAMVFSVAGTLGLVVLMLGGVSAWLKS